MVASRFEFARKVEASVEIDPRRLTFQHVIALREAGMSRASIGVQDFNFEVQRAVNRIQPFDETRKAVRWLREQGFGSIAIDLIYGLPHQTLESFAQTLERLAKSGVRRLAVMCPSFTADCLETLEEIAIRGRRLFLQAGGTDFTMIRALNDRAEWGNAIAQILGSFERG